MGIRLKGNLANNNRIDKNNESYDNSLNFRGFGLKFTNGLTYDLDKIAAVQVRNDSSMPLLIEVKNRETIANLLKGKIVAKISCIEKDDEVKEKILNIIANAMEKYSITDINNSYFNSFVILYINSELNRYLKSIYDGNDGLKFTVNIEQTEKIIDITYNFENEEGFRQALTSVYEKYKNKLEDVKEGGLAISATKDGDLAINSNDYKKYLLDKDSYKSTTQPTTPGNRKPLIIWHEGTDDATTDSSDLSADTILELEKQIQELLEKQKHMIELPNFPSESGKYTFIVSIRNGKEPEYSWGEPVVEKHFTLTVEPNPENPEMANVMLGPIKDSDYKKILGTGTYDMILDLDENNFVKNEDGKTYNLVEVE